ncbi:MAG: glycosyltransferase family 4 protein [Planctomycetota bacterium]
MRILLIGESLDGPAARYRLQPLAASLRRMGGDVVLAEARSGRSSRRQMKRLARTADLVVLQRRLWGLLDIPLLRRACRSLVYDVDDAVCYADGSQENFLSLARLLKFRAICRRADLVVAGNDYIAGLASRHGASRVLVVPTCLAEVPPLAGRPERSVSRPVMVWIGGASTRRYLEAFAPVLRELAPAGGGVTLRVVADQPVSLPGVETEFVKWSLASERTALSSVSMGIAPLPDDPWTRGKCGLKLLQYGGAGLPSVASPVGVHREIVVHGETGFLATSAGEWREAVGSLLADPERGSEMGERAHARVMALYTWPVWEAAWLEAIEDLVEEG